jgi:orotate phosphoribosyltransferase
VARALEIPFFFTERADGAMALRRGFVIAPGTRVIVVEDVVTTGKSTREVMDAVTAAGGVVVGVASIVNRSGQDNPFSPLTYTALLALEVDNHPPETCPMCAAGSPVVKPGSRPGA